MPDTMPRKFQICVFVLILFLFFHRDNRVVVALKLTHMVLTEIELSHVGWIKFEFSHI